MTRRISAICLHHRSLACIQLISFTIACLTIFYLILSTFSLTSIKYLSPQPWIPFNFNTHNISYTQRITSSSDHTNNSFICDRLRINDGTRDTNVTSPIDDHLLNILRPYCEIIPTPRQQWIRSERYVESDVVFLIYTDPSFYQDRATSLRDTCLSRVTHKYFFAQTSYPSLPITLIQSTTDKYSSHMNKLSAGLQTAYQQHGHKAKFYFVGDCETFVNVAHLLKHLDRYDDKDALLIGGSASTGRCYRGRKQSNEKISYPSAHAGILLTAQLMNMIVPKLDGYLENDWPVTDDKVDGDLALSCLAYSMGVNASLEDGFWSVSPEQVHTQSDKRRLVDGDGEMEVVTYHNIHPLSMHVLDEFYVHQMLDRLGNDGNFDELMSFSRAFVISHYHLLRMKRQECTLPAVPIIRKQ